MVGKYLHLDCASATKSNAFFISTLFSFLFFYKKLLIESQIIPSSSPMLSWFLHTCTGFSVYVCLFGQTLQIRYSGDAQHHGYQCSISKPQQQTALLQHPVPPGSIDGHF